MISRLDNDMFLEYRYGQVRNSDVATKPWYEFIYNNADVNSEPEYYYGLALQNHDTSISKPSDIVKTYRSRVCKDVLELPMIEAYLEHVFIHTFPGGTKALLISIPPRAGVELLRKKTLNIKDYYKELK